MRHGFSPALALGSDPSLERLQRLDAQVHLDLLSQLTPRREMLDIAAEASRSEGV
ncbi:MAG: T6SS immunity protein Tdi1 domain-containing protein [Inhella sp.]